MCFGFFFQFHKGTRRLFYNLLIISKDESFYSLIKRRFHFVDYYIIISYWKVSSFRWKFVINIVEGDVVLVRKYCELLFTLFFIFYVLIFLESSLYNFHVDSIICIMIFQSVDLLLGSLVVFRASFFFFVNSVPGTSIYSLAHFLI